MPSVRATRASAGTMLMVWVDCAPFVHPSGAVPSARVAVVPDGMRESVGRRLTVKLPLLPLTVMVSEASSMCCPPAVTDAETSSPSAGAGTLSVTGTSTVPFASRSVVSALPKAIICGTGASSLSVMVMVCSSVPSRQSAGSDPAGAESLRTMVSLSSSISSSTMLIGMSKPARGILEPGTAREIVKDEGMPV